jgi:hypothetical protein
MSSKKKPTNTENGATGHSVPAVPPKEPLSVTPDRARSTQSDPGKRGRLAPNSRYTDQEVERGLVALALCSGQRRRASKLLAKQGLKISDGALRYWKEHAHEDWYWEIQARIMPRVRAIAAEKHSELAELEGEASRQLLDRLMTEADEIPARDLPGAVRNLDVAAAVNRDKAAMLRGEPTEIVEHQRDALQILRQLKEMGMPLPADMEHAIESTAEEILDKAEEPAG